MSIETILKQRSDNKCELCGATDNLTVYSIPPKTITSADKSILVCGTCHNQIENADEMDFNHWRCLNDSMWSSIPAVQVMSWRMLKRITAEGWPQDLLDMLYLEDDVKKWAMSDNSFSSNEVPTVDINGVKLNTGDSVTQTKDVFITGANFTVKRGTMIRGIAITANPREIEGKVNGTRIVLGARYLKKM